MRAAVSLTDGLGLDGDRCIRVIPRQVPAATYVKMSGDACNHTHEWQLLGLNMGLDGNF